MTLGPSTEEGDRTHELGEWLEHIRSTQPLDGIDELTRVKLRPAASELLEGGSPLTPQHIAGIWEAAHITVLRAATALRGREILSFWRPLLTSCQAGDATAPLKDLRSVIGELEALERALEAAAGYGSDREVGLERLRKLLHTLEGFLPREHSESFQHARYETLTHHERPVQKKRPWYLPHLRAETKITEPRTALLFGILLALAGLYLFINQGFEAVMPAGPPPQLEAYRRALPETQSRSFDGGDLTITVHGAWAGKARSAQLGDLLALRGATRHEEFDLLIIITEQGRTIVAVTRDGDFMWADP